MSSNGNDTATSIGKAVVTFSGQRERQLSEWRSFEQLFLAAIREIGIGDILTGRGRHPEEPTGNDSAKPRQRFSTKSAKYEKLNGILYGKLLTAVANGSLGYESLAVFTALALSPIYPETEGHGYEAFQTLKTKDKAEMSFKPWDLEQR